MYITYFANPSTLLQLTAMCSSNLHLSFFLAPPSQAQASRTRRLPPQGGLQPRISGVLGTSGQRRIRSSASGHAEAAATSQLLPPRGLERSLWWTAVHCTLHFALMSAYLEGECSTKVGQ